jgi:hypothetical protein
MTDKTRQQVNIKKLVGRTEHGEYYYADYAFEHRHGDEPFIGVTGTVLRPISKDEYDERTDIENVTEYLEEIWRCVVADGGTDRGLDDWVQDVINSQGVDETVFDLSHYSEGEDPIEHLSEIGELDPDDFVDFCECIGGGRFVGDAEFVKVYDPVLLDRINRVENNKVSWFDHEEEKQVAAAATTAANHKGGN